VLLTIHSAKRYRDVVSAIESRLQRFDTARDRRAVTLRATEYRRQRHPARTQRKGSEMCPQKRTSYSANRFNVRIPAVREFQARYEAAVPDLPAPEIIELVANGEPWSEVESLVDTVAPFGFMIIHRIDHTHAMTAAGNSAECVAYLMGNPVIAERMFRHDPRAMLYAPLRTLLWEDPSGNAWFTVDQPSALFGSIGSELLEVGRELDHKLGSLLEALDAPIPELLGD
jgi:uncharacterized protein (DUF302 family)